MRRRLLAANWKMHGSCESVRHLIEGIFQQTLPPSLELLLFPSHLHICQVSRVIDGKNIVLGAQNCAEQAEEGALTGEIAACQLKDAGCSWVLLGHSERRIRLSETNKQIALKFAAAQSVGLQAMLCVGETKEQREAGETHQIVEQQLAAIIATLGIEALSQAALAYEPVWAIGTGLSASPEQAQQVHAAIRAQLAQYSAEIAENIAILYGGSVKAANAAELFAMPDIDGGLVGGASLNAQEFGAICRALGS